jgi:hypothetical protein
MRKKGKIIVEITDEEITLEVEGVKGKACIDLTRPLEEELGVVEERKLTREYYERETQSQRQRHRIKW